MKQRFNGICATRLKKQVAEMAISHLEAFQQRYRQIVSDPGSSMAVLREGATAWPPSPTPPSSW